MDNFTLEFTSEEFIFTLSNGQTFSFPSYMFTGVCDAIMQGADMQYAVQVQSWHKAGRDTAINWRSV